MSATSVDVGDDLPLTVPALLAAQVHRGDQKLLVCDDLELSYADADRQSAAVAKGLLAVGCGPGSRVGLLHPNGPDFVVAALAAARIGAVAMPFSTFSTATELSGLLQRADVEYFFATTSYRSHDYVATLQGVVPELDLANTPPVLSPTVPALRRILFDQTIAGVHPAWTVAAAVAAGATVDDKVLAAAEARVRPSDRLVVVHTSGSTSEPKGVIHQHGPLLRHVDNLNELRAFDDTEVLFSNSPFFWVGGFAYTLLGTLLAGATLVCSNATDAGAALDLIERTRPTLMNGFAATVAHLAEHPSFAARDLSFIERGNLWPIMPAEVCPPDVDLRHNMLGMTETGSVCLASDDESDQPEHRRGSFGKPVPGLEPRLVDPETGEICDTGALGELWFRGPFLMEGYLGRERHETFHADGWYRTGDLLHTDTEGFYYFTGRHGDMIKTGGANVAPREVEAAILEETGLAAHVIGIDDPDRGQVVAAAIRVPEGQAGPDPDELRVALRTHLSAYKVPRRYLVLPDTEVPMLSSGKLDGLALKELFGDY